MVGAQGWSPSMSSSGGPAEASRSPASASGDSPPQLGRQGSMRLHISERRFADKWPESRTHTVAPAMHPKSRRCSDRRVSSSKRIGRPSWTPSMAGGRCARIRPSRSIAAPFGPCWLRRYAEQARVAHLDRGGHALDIFASPDFNIFYDAATLIVICATSSGHSSSRTAGWRRRI